MYDHKKIEAKWQEKWAKENLYKTVEDKKKAKYYVLDMFPYPSGVGLHVGHPRGYIATDVLARYKMLNGFNVLHPMGWDAFGLPAENYALANKVHPQVATDKNIVNYQRQLNFLGLSYDWSREINTTDPAYYKWTQWAFIKMFERGLVYESHEPINWCPTCQTGLANEDVEDSRCERCGTIVEKKPMRQWVIKITDYAERLLNDLDKLPEWEEPIKEMQRNWIGRSEGAEILFAVIPAEAGIQAIGKNEKGLDSRLRGNDNTIKVFTTRPDTIFGATYLVLCPEHELLKNYESGIKNYEEVKKYITKTKNKSDLERTDLNKDKTGVELKGVKAINPASNEEIPIWVADYVLPNYGTGAIMAVPAHDQRDFEFTKKYKMSIKPVVAAAKHVSGLRFDEKGVAHGTVNDLNNSYDDIYTLEEMLEIIEKDGAQELEEGMIIESLNNEVSLNGLRADKAKEKIIAWLEKKKIGQGKIQYKLKDWVFSRQRYWGEPIPLIHCEHCGVVAVPESELPLRLPDVEHYEPSGTGESPLATITDWVNTTCPKCGGPAKRETNTMPQWAGSSWYYLRYCDPRNKKELIAKAKAKYWLPVDFYVGGAEHATRHLIYARFWHKFLQDIGVVAGDEPFIKYRHVGLILATDGKKMSKRWNNVINPDDIIISHGADALRVYEMFMGPFGEAIAWNTNGLEGTRKFLEKIYHIAHNTQHIAGKSNNDLKRLLHKTIKKVESDIENFKFNTAVSALMILVNKMTESADIAQDDWRKFLVILAPFAPHLAEELWSSYAEATEDKEEIGRGSIFKQPWPKFDPKEAKDEVINFVVQINGKLRDTITVPADISEAEAKQLALASDKIAKWLEGKKPDKIIYVKGRLVNIVV